MPVLLRTPVVLRPLFATFGRRVLRIELVLFVVGAVILVAEGRGPLTAFLLRRILSVVIRLSG